MGNDMHNTEKSDVDLAIVYQTITVKPLSSDMGI